MITLAGRFVVAAVALLHALLPANVAVACSAIENPTIEALGPTQLVWRWRRRRRTNP